MGIAMDDFSFPQVADDEIVKLTITPSLWRISSLVFPEYNHHKQEENDDTNNMHDLQTKSSGSWADEKMDTLWEDMNDDDYNSQSLVAHQQGDVQSFRKNHNHHQESFRKSKINTVVIKVTKKLFSHRIRIMAGVKKC